LEGEYNGNRLFQGWGDNYLSCGSGDGGWLDSVGFSVHVNLLFAVLEVLYGLIGWCNGNGFDQAMTICPASLGGVFCSEENTHGDGSDDYEGDDERHTPSDVVGQPLIADE